MARSFFPHDARRYANLLVDDSAFETTGAFTLGGVLAHELGHVLGFRHEHTRPQAAVCFEDNEWRALTPYDPYSVMHYPQCHGKAKTLALTDNDKRGAALLYGAP